MVHKFSDNSNNPARALQIWQILIGKAYNRQTMTYGDLAGLLRFGGATPVINILDYIMRYCDQNKLPPLTVLVVNKDTGIPGSGLTTVDNLGTAFESVFTFDWYALIPPTPEEFRAVKD